MQRQKHSVLPWDPQNDCGRRERALSDECASVLVRVLDFTRYASRREVTSDSQHINNDPIEFYLLLLFKEFVVFKYKL